LIGKRYKGEKKEHGGDRKSIMHSAQLNPTVQKIAEQSKVNPSTVQRAEKFADAVDKVAENVGINHNEYYQHITRISTRAF